MNKYLLLLLIAIIAVFSSVQLFAQEEVEYSWGTVVKISSQQILVLEYDYEEDADLEVAYFTDPSLKVEGVESLQDITVGRGIDIEYVVQNGRKVAKVIIAENQPEPEEDSSFQEYDDSFETE